MSDEHLRFPVGRFRPDPDPSPDTRRERIAEIAALPARLREAVAGLSPAQWETPYRPAGWTVRQVVHHLPDSHLNAYCRLKLALTESTPVIKPYDEAAWAELPDREVDPEVSLRLLEALHRRWVHLLGAMGEEDFSRTLEHPEHGRVFTLDEMLALYAWHGRHHLAHITSLAAREGWRGAADPPLATP
jgi:uncharacterized damage-inducible protein DinB